ncbi:MAG: lmo0937 family membrane protein [Bacteroidota bacterium]
MLYVVAIILVIGWVIGVFGYKAGGIVHLLLFVALFIVVLRLIRGKKLL